MCSICTMMFVCIYVYDMCMKPIETMDPPPAALDAVSSSLPSKDQSILPPMPNPMRPVTVTGGGRDDGNGNLLKNILYTIFLKHSVDADVDLETALKKHKSDKLRRREFQTQTVTQDEGMAIPSHSVSGDEIIIEPALSNSFEESKSQSSLLQSSAQPQPPLPPSREDKILAIKRTMQQLSQTMQALQEEINALG